MDPDQARAYTERWHVVAEAERAELRSTSLEQKLRQLSQLMESARSLKWATTDAREVDEVRARWNRLAIHYRG